MDEQAARRIWETALGQLQLQVSRTNYDTWLKETIGLGSDNGHFVVGTNSDFTSEWLASRLRPLIVKTLSTLLDGPLDVSFQLLGHNDNGFSETPLFSNGAGKESSAPSPARPRVNGKFTFDRFIVGDSNRMAVAAALASADQPGQAYNPLFIFGAHGLGKTHLLHAATHRAHSLGHRVHHTSAEQFTNEFVNAIAQGRTADFHSKHRNVDLLLIDDIQFLGGKKQTQEAFLYVFNELHAGGCQFIITSDRAPRSIAGLAAPLRSRFVWGLVTEIHPPDLETRSLVLRAKAREQHTELPSEVAHTIVTRATDNIRELEGYLNRVLAHARLNRVSLCLETAVLALPPTTASTSFSQATPSSIINAVATRFNISEQALTSKSLATPLTEARQLAVYLLREDARLSLKEIGSLLGNRNHSTISHAYQRLTSALPSNRELALQVTEVRGLLQLR